MDPSVPLLWSSFLNRITLTGWRALLFYVDLHPHIEWHVGFKLNIISPLLVPRVFMERMAMFNRATHHSFSSQPVPSSWFPFPPQTWAVIFGCQRRKAKPWRVDPRWVVTVGVGKEAIIIAAGSVHSPQILHGIISEQALLAKFNISTVL